MGSAFSSVTLVTSYQSSPCRITERHNDQFYFQNLKSTKWSEILQVVKYADMLTLYCPVVTVCILLTRSKTKRFCTSPNLAYMSQSKWPRGLRPGNKASRLLGFRFRILPRAWMCLWWALLSCRGPCFRLITRPEESYRVWYVWVWSKTSTMRSFWPIGGRRVVAKKSIYVFRILYAILVTLFNLPVHIQKNVTSCNRPRFEFQVSD